MSPADVSRRTLMASTQTEVKVSLKQFVGYIKRSCAYCEAVEVP